MTNHLALSLADDMASVWSRWQIGWRPWAFRCSPWRCHACCSTPASPQYCERFQLGHNHHSCPLLIEILLLKKLDVPALTNYKCVVIVSSLVTFITACPLLIEILLVKKLDLAKKLDFPRWPCT